MTTGVVIWILLSIGVGLIGANRKIGFWVALFASLVLSPLLGLIFTFTTKSNSADQHQELIDQLKSGQPHAPSIYTQLSELDKLKADNLITEDEYQTKRKQLLGL